MPKNFISYLNFTAKNDIIDTYRILFYKILESLMTFCGLLTAASIDGVGLVTLEIYDFVGGTYPCDRRESEKCPCKQAFLLLVK